MSEQFERRSSSRMSMSWWEVLQKMLFAERQSVH